MSKMFADFNVGNFFTIEKTISHDKSDLTAGNQYDYITRSVGNRGIIAQTGHIDDESLNESGNFSLELMNCTFFYREKPWYAGQFVRKVVPKDKNVALQWKYFEAMFCGVQKALKDILVRNVDKAFQDCVISLPIQMKNKTKPVIDKTYTYNTDGYIPDWNYMQERIKELEQKRIKELEQERIKELDAYLVASGLEDYELTEEDKQTLSLSEKTAFDKDRTSQNDSKNWQVKFKEFRMGDIFEQLPVKKAKKKNVRKYCSEEFCVPVVYAKAGDNGIMYWGRKNEFTTYANVISIVYNGAIAAGLVYAQEKPTGILAESYLIRTKDNENVPFRANLYMARVIENTIYPKYSRENLATWNNRVENDIITLPVNCSGEIDFDYMDKYIHALEKTVIADVVEYKNKVIETTKKVVGE